MQDPNISDKLLQQLDVLLLKQKVMQQEIQELRKQVLSISSTDVAAPAAPPAGESSVASPATGPAPEPVSLSSPQQPRVRSWKEETAASQQPTRPASTFRPTAIPAKSDLEKFIGENLINKIGILITVIGVAIGAKYSIDNELINPITRIIMGYCFGLGLMGTAIYLKKKYLSLSAVLLSGALAIMYFITYTAYSFYELLPQMAAFALMLIFTCFTVVAALHYNLQVIAHIGLVGAYAVPVLLSDGSGRVHILFSYMAIINSGILIIAYKRYWKPLYYLAFTISWLIFLGWFAFSYSMALHFGIGLGFSALFFVLFYLSFLGYKLSRREQFNQSDVVLLLLNSFVFFGLGIGMLNDHEVGRHYLGLFTLLNAVVHLLVCIQVYRNKLADRNLFYLMAGLVLIFITIAIPIQLDGNWVTLLWAGGAALLFWIGRSKNVTLYRNLSLPLMLLAFLSLIHDWVEYYPVASNFSMEEDFRTILNPTFLTSMLCIAAFAFMAWTNHITSIKTAAATADLFSYCLGSILLVMLYFSFELEIAAYWIGQYAASAIELPETGSEFSELIYNDSLLHFKTVWVINYSLLFVTLLVFFNLLKLKNKGLAWLSLGLAAFTMVAFLAEGLEALSRLRYYWLQTAGKGYYSQGIANLLIRYLSFALAALLLWAVYRLKRQPFVKARLLIAYDFLLYASLLWIVSDELIHWMHLWGFEQSDKLALSILWGIYALTVIGIGINQNKKHLRIGAFILFGVILIKLFFYDIAHLDTIAKTIVMVSLGILLLIISFLYNKYKHLIADANQDEPAIPGETGTTSTATGGPDL